MSDNLPATPTVPTLTGQLVTSLSLKAGTALAGLLAAHGWLSTADQSTTAAQIGAVVIGLVSIGLTIWRDRHQVQNAKALAITPPSQIKQ